MLTSTLQPIETSRAVILAAGTGSRLKTYTRYTPKALMKVNDEFAIVRIIRSLVASGINDIAINLHAHASQIQDALGDGSQFNANLYYSHEAHLLDSGGGVRTALDLLPKGEGVLVHNTDILTTMNLQQLITSNCGGSCHLSLVPNPAHNPEGDFSLEGQHIVPAKQKTYTYSGISVWDEDVLRVYPASQPFSLVEPIQTMIKVQKCVGKMNKDTWFDIGSPRSLVQANRFYKEANL